MEKIKKIIVQDKRIIVITIGVVLALILGAIFISRQRQNTQYKNLTQKITTQLKTVEKTYQEGEAIINRSAIVKSSGDETIATTYTAIVNDYTKVLNESMKIETNGHLIKEAAYNDKRIAPSINKYVYTHTGDFYYGYYDIDHNGVNELVIGYKGVNDENISPIEIYGYNQRAKFIVNASSLNQSVDNNAMSIMKDGVIALRGELGDQAAYLTVGHIDKDGYTFKVDQTLKSTDDNQKGTISAEEMGRKQDNYKTNVSIKWHQMSKPKSAAQWQKAYKDIINIFKQDEDYQFELIYTTKNNLPSLYVTNKENSEKRFIRSYLFTYSINGLKKTSLKDDTISYVDRVGVLQASRKVENKVKDVFYQFTDKGIQVIHTGTRYTKWDQEKVSKETYQQQVNQLMGVNEKNKLLTVTKDDLSSYSDIIETINQL